MPHTMISIPEQPCTLDDSTRIVQGRIIYAHHLRNPHVDTNSLVFVSHPEELYRIHSNIDEILSSYVSAAADGHPIIACQHYQEFPLLRTRVTHFVNRRTLPEFPYEHKARFYDTDWIARRTSETTERLFRKHEIRPGWQETDGILIYMPAQIPFTETLRKQRENEQESFKQFLHRMRRNYAAAYY